MSFNEMYLKGDNTYLDYDRFVREGGKLVEVDTKDAELMTEVERVIEKYTKDRVFRVLLTPDARDYTAVCYLKDENDGSLSRLFIHFTEPNGYGAVRVYHMKDSDKKVFVFPHLFVSSTPSENDSVLKSFIIKALEKGREWRKEINGGVAGLEETRSNVLEQLRKL